MMLRQLSPFQQQSHFVVYFLVINTDYMSRNKFSQQSQTNLDSILAELSVCIASRNPFSGLPFV